MDNLQLVENQLNRISWERIILSRTYDQATEQFEQSTDFRELTQHDLFKQELNKIDKQWQQQTQELLLMFPE